MVKYLWWLAIVTVFIVSYGVICPSLISLPNTLANIIGVVVMFVATPLTIGLWMIPQALKNNTNK